jgi:hypothetical protein
MTIASRMTHVKTAFWLASFLAIVLVACGNLTSSPHDAPDTSSSGNSSPVQAGTTHGGGSTSSWGGASGGLTLVMTTAGTTSSTPLGPGTAGEGGQPDYPAIVRLCIYPEDIPEHWGQGGEGGAETGERGCIIGELGNFDYMGCLYDLVSSAPFNVDPFVGGHSHCCYAAKLLACK